MAGSTSIGDGGAGAASQLSDAQGVAVDRLGNVYIADAGAHRVRKVNTSGAILTLAGDGTPGFSGDGGRSDLARLNAPYGVAADSAGNVYVADLGNHRVRKITPEGTISTVAGTGDKGDLGDGGSATSAQLTSPRNLAFDSAGNLYISDFEAHRIRKVTPDGLIRTVAGTGVAGNRGDGGTALQAELAYPAGIVIDPFGILYIADSGNSRVRQVTNGIMNPAPLGTVVFNLPTGVATDNLGNLYIAEAGARRVWKRTIATNTVSVILGGQSNFNPIPVLDTARDIAMSARGDLY
ncbi:MAG: hypothetical protein ABIZ80_07820, partial [Bryobacteraceae bacterium]